MIDWQTVIIAAIAGLPATIVAVGTLWKLIKTDEKIDGRLSQLLKAATDGARLSGAAGEASAERGRKVARARARKA